MNDLLRTLAMNSLFMIRDMMLILIYDFGFTSGSKLVLRDGLDENIIDAWNLFHKVSNLAPLSKKIQEFVWCRISEFNFEFEFIV